MEEDISFLNETKQIKYMEIENTHFLHEEYFKTLLKHIKEDKHYHLNLALGRKPQYYRLKMFILKFL